MSAESATAITRAPAAAATCTAIRPTPPIPLTTTVCPSPIPARRDAWTTDIPLQASTAAVSNETDSGSGIRFSAGTRTTSANPPSSEKPSWPTGSVQSDSRPVRQGVQRPQPTKL